MSRTLDLSSPRALLMSIHDLDPRPEKLANATKKRTGNLSRIEANAALGALELHREGADAFSSACLTKRVGRIVGASLMTHLSDKDLIVPTTRPADAFHPGAATAKWWTLPPSAVLVIAEMENALADLLDRCRRAATMPAKEPRKAYTRRATV